MTRVGTITPEGYVQWQPTQEQQDALDGAALRKLREALPAGANHVEVVIREERRKAQEPSVFVVECGECDGEGPTVADAAREALEARE